MITVGICTQNPRPDYLQRVVDALQRQTVSLDQWELLLIDNASQTRVAEQIDLSWHPHARHLREETPGVTHARLRGIEEALGEIVVWLDDDNVPADDFLATGIYIGVLCPQLGAWGGQVIPEFEVDPPEKLKPYLRSYLMIREFTEARWSNLCNYHVTAPGGAGMWLRKEVAQAYREKIRSDRRSLAYSRRENLIVCGEDSDMALCALPLGMGTGIFPDLRITHLIPSTRLTEEFFLRAAFGGGYSFTLLDYLHGVRTSRPKSNRALQALRSLRRAMKSRFSWQLERERRRGEDIAWKQIREWQKCQSEDRK
ncbi:MAG: glycosyltransferase [Terracidiphilus sp.]|nr:glycosyltransferase [Terracidiphilus sp.]